MREAAVAAALTERAKRALTDHDMWMRLHLDTLAGRIYGGVGSILGLHRVRPAEEASTLTSNRRLEITPQALDDMLGFLRRERMRFVSMDEAEELITAGRPGPRWVALTIDDGYRDNLTHALPVFEKHGVPFTVYVTTCFPDRTAVQWWYVLEDLLLSRAEILVRLNEQTMLVPTATLDEKNAAFETLGPAVAFAGNADSAARISEILGDSAGDLTRHSRDNALSWEDVSQLARSPIATIGAHTTNHLSLAHLDEPRARGEIAASVRRLSDACGRQVDHFAYPYGGRTSANAREFKMVRESRLRTAVTTREANVFREHARHLECLPRLGVTMEMLRPDEWALKLWLSGLVPCHENRFKRVVTE